MQLDSEGTEMALVGFQNLTPPVRAIPVVLAHGREAMDIIFNVFGMAEQGQDLNPVYQDYQSVSYTQWDTNLEATNSCVTIHETTLM